MGPLVQYLYTINHIISLLQVSFEYSASQLDIVESFWRFHVPEQNINIPFLMVGQALEPDVVMDRSHMNFKALLIGRCSSMVYRKALYTI